jgi:hypothetical protein
MRKVSRRQLISGSGLAVVGFALGYGAKSISLSTPAFQPTQPPSSPDEALQRLLDGNQVAWTST